MFNFFKKNKFVLLQENYKAKTLELVIACSDIANNNSTLNPSIIIKVLIDTRSRANSYDKNQLLHLNSMYEGLIECDARTRYVITFSTIMLLEANINTMPLYDESNFHDLVGTFISNVEPMKKLITYKQ